MTPHQWRKGRNRRWKETSDPLRPLELLTMAAATSQLASGQTAASVAHLCGIRPPTVEQLVPLIEPAQLWGKLQLVSAASRLQGREISELERLFRGVDRALGSATPQQLTAVRPFTTSLVGPTPPSSGFSELAVSGARSLFALASLDQHDLQPVPLGRAGTDLKLDWARPESPWARKCWLEAVALGLLKARLRYKLSSSPEEVGSQRR